VKAKAGALVAEASSVGKVALRRLASYFGDFFDFTLIGRYAEIDGKGAVGRGARARNGGRDDGEALEIHLVGDGNWNGRDAVLQGT
nr:hypothetical protein [Tanacetum cinerariifolium]